jgi:circadian clock protein KaiC
LITSAQANVQDLSGIKKTLTGIKGFDGITGGGLPSGGTTLLVGAPGCGKTLFALQTLVDGARNWSEPGIFVAFEENTQRIIQNAASFGWDLPSLEKDSLFFLDAHIHSDAVSTGSFDLIGLLTSVAEIAKELNAKRVVFDSLDVMLAPLDNPLLERQEIYRVHEWLTNSGMTAVVTVKDDGGPLNSQRYGFMQFMADCVVMLNHTTQDRISLRELQISKYRGSGFSENAFPMTIGPHGISVAGTEPRKADYPVFAERVSTGIARLDTMLGGGYYRGTSVLITGVPGTAKSTLAAAFAEAACLRGEPTLYVSFDESANEVMRNMASIGIQLRPHFESGLLQIYIAHAEERNAEEHMGILTALIERGKPRCVVVDPLSGMLKYGGSRSSLGIVQRLMRLTKTAGITFVGTSLMDDAVTRVEASPIEVSSVADTWIHLSYIIRAGERNRALTIVKSRGTHHSNQVRELILSDEGVTLADVYSAGGEVLMGTLRHEKDTAERAEQERIQIEVARKRRKLQRKESEISVGILALQRDLEMQRAALQDLDREQALHNARHINEQQDRLTLRTADTDSAQDNGEAIEAR